MNDELKNSEDNKNDTIDSEDLTDADAGTSEDTSVEDFRKMLNDLEVQMKKQQNELIQANESLQKSNKSLQEQISLLIRNGNSVVSNESNELKEDESEPYITLADLGNEFGKRDYRSHNSPKY